MQFNQESVSQIWDELVLLAPEYHRESGIKWPLRLKREIYNFMEQSGTLRLFTMRNDAGALVGYATFTVMQHTHYDCMVACQDTQFVIVSARGLGSGKFLLYQDRMLAGMGVQQVIRFAEEAGSYFSALSGMGYKWKDVVLTKEI